MTYKNWSKRKIDTLMRIYPYYSDQKLAEIIGCGIEDIIEFHKNFPKITKEAFRPGRKKRAPAKQKGGKNARRENCRYHIKNNGADYYLYCDDDVLFRTCSEERLMKYVREKKIKLDQS